MLTFTHTVDGVPTDVDSIELSDPTGLYGFRRTDDNEILIPDGEDFTRVSVGVYEYDISGLTLVENTIYDYWIEWTYDGETNHQQRFINEVTDGGEPEPVSYKTLRFVLMDAGETVLATSVKLSNPMSSFGVIRTDTGERVVADGTSYAATGTLYSANVGEPAPNLTYKYYVEVDYNGVVLHIPASTKLVESVALVLGRYTNSQRLALMFGVDSIHKWMTNNSDERDEPVDYSPRMHEFIRQAEAEIDSFVRGPYVGDAFAADDVPNEIADAATMLAGVRMYEASGIIDMNVITGEPEHRYKAKYRQAQNILRRVRIGAVPFEGILSPGSAPGVVDDLGARVELPYPWSELLDET